MLGAISARLTFFFRRSLAPAGHPETGPENPSDNHEDDSGDMLADISVASLCSGSIRARGDKELNGFALRRWLLQDIREEPWSPFRLSAVEVRNDLQVKAKI